MIESLEGQPSLGNIPGPSLDSCQKDGCVWHICRSEGEEVEVGRLQGENAGYSLVTHLPKHV